MFEKNQLSNYNDPYYLKQYYKNKACYNQEDISKICYHIPFLTNHNSLNFIFLIFFNKHIYNNEIYFQPTMNYNYTCDPVKTIFESLLLQNCITNNTSRLNYIRVLIIYLSSIIKLSCLLNLTFTKKYYDIIPILFSNKYAITAFVSYIRSKHKDETNIDMILDEIIFLKNKQVISLTNLYHEINRLKEDDLLLKSNILKYLEQFVDTKSVNLIDFF
jgi:hypothetical protein